MKIRIEGNLKELEKVRKTIESFLKNYSSDEEGIFALLLMVDEVVTNIIKYGYREMGGEIWLQVLYQDGEVEVLIDDQAPPFNPLQHPQVDMENRLQKGFTHGFGIQVVRTFSDSCEYQQLDHGNRLIIRKKLA
ncbi:ATP-binding protein [Thermospira aquatica]|uniref:ATP-binding protein n=1 Tax=Thermospira aquatica TaxID=2828656 RepID=A0AAX3BHR5_9SPIR|nr:ATP-binding protein [Thermospira aquatica]URA10951.1 ATP-binding protein [Thermospira aquatica]